MPTGCRKRFTGSDRREPEVGNTIAQSGFAGADTDNVAGQRHLPYLLDD